MEFFKEGDEDINLSGLSSEFLKTVIVKKYISLDKANRLLRERGRVVRTNPKYISPGHWAPIFSDGDTHQALLINIEPIEKDSAEKILDDLIKIQPIAYDLGHAPIIHRELIERAKKLRGGK